MSDPLCLVVGQRQTRRSAGIITRQIQEKDRKKGRFWSENAKYSDTGAGENVRLRCVCDNERVKGNSLSMFLRDVEIQRQVW